MLSSPLSIALVLGFGFFLVYGIWEVALKKSFTEAKDLEERSTIKAMRKVFLRKLGSYNRKFMWPKYEAKVNKRIISAGGLDGLKAEEILTLQELALVFFTVLGILVT